MTGGWKQKSGWIQIFPASGVPSTFPFLSQPSVCLLVSRVRAYLTTDQQHTDFALLFIQFLTKHTMQRYNPRKVNKPLIASIFLS